MDYIKRKFPWIFEILSLIICFISFVALVALLRVFDGRTVFQWHGITLNTVVSAISIVIRALLVYSIAECIGQWKWILFSRSPRSLMDFERLDSASRGPVGSASLTWRKNIPRVLPVGSHRPQPRAYLSDRLHRWILRIGLVVTVLSLAIDSFSQQLVQLEQRTNYVASYNGKIACSPRAYGYSESWHDNDNSRSLIYSDHSGLQMQSAILAGLSLPTDSIQQQANVSCPTGNCTWAPFTSLSVCHKCNDLTSKIKKVRKFGDITSLAGAPGEAPTNISDDLGSRQKYFSAFYLPNGLFLGSQDGCDTDEMLNSKSCLKDHVEATNFLVASYGTSESADTVSMQYGDHIIWSMSAVYIDDAAFPPKEQQGKNETPLHYWPDVPIRAAECSLYYCVKTFNDRIENNILHETTEEVKDVVPKPFSLMPEGSAELVLYHPNKSHEPEFHVRIESVLGIKNYLQQILVDKRNYHNGALNFVREHIPGAKVLLNSYASPGPASSVVMYPLGLKRMMTGHSFSMNDQFEALAISMTNSIRNDGLEAADTKSGIVSDTGPAVPASGSIGLPTTVYRAEWQWALLHGTVLLLGAMFCIVTMISARLSACRQHIWKNHSLATMKQGADTGHALREANTTREIEETAQNATVLMPFNRKTGRLEQTTEEEIRPLAER